MAKDLKEQLLVAVVESCFFDGKKKFKGSPRSVTELCAALKAKYDLKEESFVVTYFDKDIEGFVDLDDWEELMDQSQPFKLVLRPGSSAPKQHAVKQKQSKSEPQPQQSADQAHPMQLTGDQKQAKPCDDPKQKNRAADAKETKQPAGDPKPKKKQAMDPKQAKQPTGDPKQIPQPAQDPKQTKQVPADAIPKKMQAANAKQTKQRGASQQQPPAQRGLTAFEKREMKAALASQKIASENEVAKDEERPSTALTLLPSTSDAFIIIAGTLAFFLFAFRVYRVKTAYLHGKSSMEREAKLVSENAFYYSFFKDVVMADSLYDALNELVYNWQVEYPDTVNCLQRFNIAQEIAVGMLGRMCTQVPLVNSMFCADDTSPSEHGEAGGYHLEHDPEWLLPFYLSTLFTVYSLGMGCFVLLASRLNSTGGNDSSSSNNAGLFGAVAAGLLYLSNWYEASRLWYQPPLRENWCIPVLFLQHLHMLPLLRQAEERGGQEGGLTGLGRERSWQLARLLSSTVALLLTWQVSEYLVTIEAVAILLLQHLHYLPARTGVQLLLTLFVATTLSQPVQLLKLLHACCFSVAGANSAAQAAQSFLMGVRLLMLWLLGGGSSIARAALVQLLLCAMLSPMLYARVLSQALPPSTPPSTPSAGLSSRWSSLLLLRSLTTRFLRLLSLFTTASVVFAMCRLLCHCASPAGIGGPLASGLDYTLSHAGFDSEAVEGAEAAEGSPAAAWLRGSRGVDGVGGRYDAHAHETVGDSNVHPLLLSAGLQALEQASAHSHVLRVLRARLCELLPSVMPLAELLLPTSSATTDGEDGGGGCGEIPQDMHTNLYLDMDAFSPITRSWYSKLTRSLLIPLAAISFLVLFIGVCADLLGVGVGTAAEAGTAQQNVRKGAEVGVLYIAAQCVAFSVMSALMMRFIVLQVPHLCLLASLSCSQDMGSRCCKAFSCTQQCYRRWLAGHVDRVAAKIVAAVTAAAPSATAQARATAAVVGAVCVTTRKRVGMTGVAGAGDALRLVFILALLVCTDWGRIATALDLDGSKWQQQRDAMSGGGRAAMADFASDGRNAGMASLVRWARNTMHTLEDADVDGGKAVFMGDMVTTSALRLSARLAVTNHPQYESRSSRARSLLAYQVLLQYID
jgi:hypothetical protein